MLFEKLWKHQEMFLKTKRGGLKKIKSSDEEHNNNENAEDSESLEDNENAEDEKDEEEEEGV
jgi:hypothetical protein